MEDTPKFPDAPFKTPLRKTQYFGGEKMAENHNRRDSARNTFRDPRPNFSVTQVGFKPGPWSIKGKVSDISDKGVGLIIKPGVTRGTLSDPMGELEEGAYIQFQFSIRLSGTRASLPILGQVVWIRAGRGSRETRLGIRYVL